MSVTSRSPLRVAGASVNSGNVNTGEQNFTLGGAQRAGSWSGAASGGTGGTFSAPAGATVVNGADVLFFSGAGRLKDVLVHQQSASGTGNWWTFYDAGAVSSGGPFQLSGHPIIGTIPAPLQSVTVLSASGVFGVNPISPLFVFDMPFNSGLCVNGKSGGPGITVTFTPETNLPNPG